MLWDCNGLVDHGLCLSLGEGVSILEAEINSRNRAGSSFLRRLGFEITSPGNPVVFRKDLSPGKAFLGMRRT